MHLSFTEDTELWAARFAALKAFAESQVDVGLTSSASGRNLFLMAIHEHGCPVMRIPARPVIQPALSKDEARSAMAEALTAGLEAAMEGDEASAAASLEAAGEAGVEAIHAYIDAGVPPPNAPATVSGGWIYNRVAKTGVHVGGKGSDLPLYATGALYNDFDYEVKNRE